MKVLIINYRYFISGGPEKYMFNIMKVMEEKGDVVIPFSIASKKNLKSEYAKYFTEPIGGQDVHYYEEQVKNPRLIIESISRLFYSNTVKKRLKRLIKKVKPDIAYILHHYNKLSPSVIDACKEMNVPVIIRLSDYFLLCPQAHFFRFNNTCELCIEKGFRSSVVNRCVKGSYLGSFLKCVAIIFHRKILKIYDKVDGYVCTNEFMKKKMISGGFNENKLHVVRTFANKANEVSKGKGEYILYFGRFDKIKGIDILIKAYHNSRLHEKNIPLVLVGGKKVEILEMGKFTPAEEETIHKDVNIVNFVASYELQKYIQKSLFVVHPSRCYENFPNAILEAFAQLKPVITSNIGSLPEIVKHKKTGLLYNSDDIEDLKTKMEILALDDGLREEMKKYIKELNCILTPENHYAELKELFKKVCKK